MNKLHQNLMRFSSFYRQWHSNDYSARHWAIFIGVVIVILVSLTNLINRQIVSVDLLQTRAATTITAASCSQADVQAAINSALDGDTVFIPAGACTWTQTVKVGQITSWQPKAYASKFLTIQGAGIDQTVIVDEVSQTSNTYGNRNVFSIVTVDGKQFRLTGLTLQGSQTGVEQGSEAALAINGTGKQVRIDHLKFLNIWSRAMWISGYVFGVIDHNEFIGTKSQDIQINHNEWGGYIYGDGSWASPLALGTEKAIYIEDNVFNAIDGHGEIIDGTGGGRYVFRYNTVMNGEVGNHGTESGGRSRSLFSYEVYNNSFQLTPTATKPSWWTAMHWRGGTGVLFNNTVTGSYNSLTVIKTYRTFHSFAPWGACDGTGPYDVNDGVVYDSGTHTGTSGTRVLTLTGKTWVTNQWKGYSVHDVNKNNGAEIYSNTADTLTLVSDGYTNLLTFDTGDTFEIRKVVRCIDQVGNGPGDLLSGDPPTPVAWPNEVQEPLYEWNNTVNGTNGNIIAGSAGLIAGRDFFNDTPRPGYTPYTYPHPLTLSGAPPPPLPPPPSDTTPPTVSITSPLSGSTIPVKTPLTISASATDNVAVAKVDFFINGTLKCTDTTFPYTCLWKVPGKVGRTYRLQAQATDTSGNLGTSGVVTVTAK